MIKASNRFALWLAIGRILSMLVVFAMPLVLTRILSQSDYGVFSQYFTLYMTFNVIFSLGFHSNLFYFYPTAEDAKKDVIVSNTLFLLLLMSLFSVLTLSTPFIGDKLFGTGQLRNYSVFIVLSIALAVPINIISPLLTVREDKIGAVVYPPTAALLRVVTVIIAALVKNNLRFIFEALVIYQLLILLWILLYIFRNHKIRFNSVYIRRQILYSVPFGLTVAIQMFSSYFDKIISIQYLDTVQYAIYATAFLSIPGINQIYDSLCQVNVVNMTRSYQEGNLQQVRDLYRDFVVKTLSFSTPVILAVSLFAEEVIGLLYPNEYLSSAPFFRIYALTFLTAMLGAGTVLRATGKTHYSLVSYILSSIIGLPSTFVLIRAYSINGAIWGAVINIILPRILQIIIEARQTNSSLKNYLDWNKISYVLGCGVVMLLPLLVIKIALNPPLLICCLISAFYVLITYFFYLRKGVFIVSIDSITNIIYRVKRK